jgi:hypothetical protein
MYQPDEVCLGDLGVTYQERMARLRGLASLGAEVLSHLQESAQGVRGDGGSFVYLFETAEGSLKTLIGHSSQQERICRADQLALIQPHRFIVNFPDPIHLFPKP